MSARAVYHWLAAYAADRDHAALADLFGVELLWLPKRSPELNPMDTLWGQAKDVVCADKQYPSPDEQTGRFIRHLGSLSPQEALHTAGVLFDDFWLRGVL